MTAEEALETEPLVAPSLSRACGWEEPNVFFSSGDSQVGLMGEVKMSALATCLNDDILADERVVVTGFADPRGQHDENLELGLERAEAAKSELVAEGVASDRIDTYSRGEYVADGDDQFLEHRRVVVELDR